MFRLGITGGIGSGKSTVTALLATAGAGVVDIDAISRQLTASGGKAIEAIRIAFGPEFIKTDNALDREKIRPLVFANPQVRHRLETIIHPLIQHEAQLQARHLQDAGLVCTVFDIPLLVESSYWRLNLDKILVIDCLPSTQIQRVAQRSQLAESAIQQMIHAQVDRTTRLKAADLVISNEGLTLDELSLLIRHVHPCCGL
jgi:dephospho-CoA kinase